MRDEYFARLETKLWEQYGDTGAVPRFDAEKALRYSKRYLAKLDTLGLGPPKIKRGNRVWYPIPELVQWMKMRSS
jgi:hypothetical protein